MLIHFVKLYPSQMWLINSKEISNPHDQTVLTIPVSALETYSEPTNRCLKPKIYDPRGFQHWKLPENLFLRL
jgi:hypothetical protein